MEEPQITKRSVVSCLGEIRQLWPHNGRTTILQQKWKVRLHYSDGSFRERSEWLDIDHVTEQPDGSVSNEDDCGRNDKAMAGISEPATGSSEEDN